MPCLGVPTWRVVILTIAMAALSAAKAQASNPSPQGPPDDRYVKVLADCKLHGGKGFPGVLELGAPLPVVRPLLGYGREDLTFPFWYFFDKGPWMLSVVACPDWERCNFLYRIESLIVEGEGAPATANGVRVGDPESKVVAVYGDDSKGFKELLDSRGTTRTTIRMWGGDEPDVTARRTFDRSLEAGRYYPEHGLIFVFESGRVLRIVSLLQLDTLALWLRSEPDRPTKYLVTVDPSIDRPMKAGKDHPKGAGRILLPPVPELAEVSTQGIRLLLPKTWVRHGKRWTSLLGDEFVDVRAAEAARGETAQAWFDADQRKTAGRLTMRRQMRVSQSFAERIGADQCFTVHHQLPGEGIGGFDARSYVLYVAKGARRIRIEVRRSVHENYPSPDGIELARRIFTSVQLTDATPGTR